MKTTIRLISLLGALALGVAPLVRADALPASTANDNQQVWVMHFDSDWRNDSGLPEKAMLLGLQGLANRAAPRLYIIQAPDYQWEITGPIADFYRRKHGLKFVEVKTADEALGLLPATPRATLSGTRRSCRP